MSMSRRTLLKSAIFSSGMSALSTCQPHVARSRSGVSTITPSADGSCFVNCLFHGGFLVEFQQAQAQILVKAPAVTMHKYAVGSQGFLTELYKPACQSLVPLPTDNSVDMDLTTLISGLASSAVRGLADYPAIPQFSATDTKVGGLTGRYRWQIALPFPEEIIPLRMGSLADFDRVTSNGRVKESIMKSCLRNGNDKLALVVCFRYRKQPEYRACSPASVTYSFHADHPCEPSTDEINQTLRQMGTVFEHPENFDLQVTDTAVPVVPRDKDNDVKGIKGDDEKSLAEILSPGPFGTHCATSGSGGFLTKVKNCITIITGGSSR